MNPSSANGRRPLFNLPAWLSTELLLGLALNSFMVAMVAGGMGGVFPVLSILALLALVGAVGFVVVGRPARYGIGAPLTAGALLLVGAMVLGYAANLERYAAYFMLGNVASTLLALGMAYLLATRVDLDWAALLAWHAVFAIPLLAIPIASGSLVWGRVVGGAMSGDIVHPNYLGLTAMLVAIGALGVRWTIPKLLLIATAAAVMLATSSRAALVAATVALATWFGCQWAMPVPAALVARRTVRRALAVLGVLLACGAMELAGYSLVEAIAEHVLKLNDPYRGLSSGASGRAELWQAALSIWEAQPLLGVGFRGHSALMPGGSSAHSAYLSTLADTGLVGMTGYLLVCMTTLVAAGRLRRDPSRHTALALAISYVAYGVVESRALGFGNPYSILFLWIAFDAARYPIASPAAVAPGSQRANADAPIREVPLSPSIR